MHELASILTAGDDIRIWTSEGRARVPEYLRRHAQLFGAGTTERIRELSIGIVGCSGTGSPLIEQLARLGAGRLVLIDPDVVEMKNLNRVYNSAIEDAYLATPKVHVMARAIARMGLGTDVDVFFGNLISRKGSKRSQVATSSLDAPTASKLDIF
jgi:tRNA A37 threonylcarbamoyladenosine dehydratase